MPDPRLAEWPVLNHPVGSNGRVGVVNSNRIIEPLHLLQLLHNSAGEFVIGGCNSCSKICEFPGRIQIAILLIVNDHAEVAVQRLIP